MNIIIYLTPEPHLQTINISIFDLADEKDKMENQSSSLRFKRDIIRNKN